MPNASTTSTSTADPSALVPILALFLDMMKSQEDGGKNTAESTTNSSSPASGTANAPSQHIYNTIPSADASDQYLSEWYGANQGRTVYDKDGNASTIPGMSAPPSQGGAYGMAAEGQYGSPEPGTIRGWISQPKGILNGASFQNPLVAQAEKLLKDFQSTPSANANSTLVPPSPAAAPAAPAAPSTPPTPAYNPANTGAISGMVTTQPAIPPIPLVANTTVPANNPPAVTDMVGANAAQAASNPNLTASSDSFLNSIAPIMRKYRSNPNSVPMSGGNNPVPVNSPAYANLQTPVGNTMNLGALDTAPISEVSSPALGAGGADYAAGGLDSGLASGGYGASGGAASVGGAAGGMGGMSQAGGIGSSVGALITGIGKMFTPGVPGIPSMPSGVPLSQFRPAVMT